MSNSIFSVAFDVLIKMSESNRPQIPSLSIVERDMDYCETRRELERAFSLQWMPLTRVEIRAKCRLMPNCCMSDSQREGEVSAEPSQDEFKFLGFSTQ